MTLITRLQSLGPLQQLLLTLLLVILTTAAPRPAELSPVATEPATTDLSPDSRCHRKHLHHSASLSPRAQPDKHGRFVPQRACRMASRPPQSSRQTIHVPALTSAGRPPCHDASSSSCSAVHKRHGHDPAGTAIARRELAARQAANWRQRI